MANVPNYIRSIMNDHRNTVYIVGGSGKLSGFVDAETVFGASSDFGALSSSSAAQQLSNGVQLASEYTNLIDSGETFNVPSLSRVSWQSASVNGLSFDLYLVAMEEGEDLMSKVLSVYDMVLPEIATGGVDRFITPMKYNANQSGETTENHITVYIGDWFEADGFVMTSASITVSKEKINDAGTLPLYVKVSVSLMPTQVYSATQVKKWFK